MVGLQLALRMTSASSSETVQDVAILPWPSDVKALVRVIGLKSGIVSGKRTAYVHDHDEELTRNCSVSLTHER